MITITIWHYVSSSSRTLLFITHVIDKSYILFEIPANIVLRRIPPAWWFSGIICGWGIVIHVLSISL